MKKPSSFVAGIAFAVVLVGASKILHADPPPSFTAGETLSAAKLNGALTSLSSRLDALERNGTPAQAAAVPPGTIVAFAGSAVPMGWKLCDGSSVNRTDNAALFAAIGTGWGNGDGSTTFNLPDLRGRFLRGVDHGAQRDPDRAARTGDLPGQNVGDDVGSLQSDVFRTHSHVYAYSQPATVGLAGGGLAYNVVGSIQQPASQGPNIGGGSETRPKNANVNYIIKE